MSETRTGKRTCDFCGEFIDGQARCPPGFDGDFCDECFDNLGEPDGQQDHAEPTR